MGEPNANVTLKETENENASENVNALATSASSGTQRVPKLNERILSSMSRRSVAAHPWHDLDIGKLVNMAIK